MISVINEYWDFVWLVGMVGLLLTVAISCVAAWLEKKQAVINWAAMQGDEPRFADGVVDVAYGLVKVVLWVAGLAAVVGLGGGFVMTMIKIVNK